MKTKIKRLLAVIAVFSLVIYTFAACSVSDSKRSEREESKESRIEVNGEDVGLNYDSDEDFEENLNSATEEYSPKLSDECDYMLASGFGTDGNFYELVANESEDYTGTKIEFGVIKNDSWSIPLTTDCPFIGDDGLVMGKSVAYVQECDYKAFNYIGNGCFSLVSWPHNGYVTKAIWNGDNGKFFTDEDCVICNTNIYNKHRDYGQYNNFHESVADNDGIVIVKKDWMIKYLDTSTMQLTDIMSDNEVVNVNPYSEGLFASYSNGGESTKNGFYNINGEKVIDLSDYLICTPDQDFLFESKYGAKPLVFNNGYCHMDIRNDQGTKYRITIDKEGNVVESIEIE